ncbi:AAA family ATPase [Corynebacterium glutamicum]|uniref:AAA family ATPase n=1 Tax=Corynebacterium glutamicum TaxID=1718 RepID=UPI001E543D8E|nr:AAA family ATPase [Corynebacterium glutamicum]
MISKVRIRNFKGLRNYEARFSPKYNVIVGANGAGKSTLLEAIGLAIGGESTDSGRVMPFPLTGFIQKQLKSSSTHTLQDSARRCRR